MTVSVAGNRLGKRDLLNPEISNLFAQRKPAHDSQTQRANHKYDIDIHVRVFERRHLILAGKTQNQVRKEQGENDNCDR